MAKAKKKERTQDSLTPRKDGRKWIRQNLATTQYRQGKAELGVDSVLFSLYDANAFEGPVTEVAEKILRIRDYYEAQGFRRIAIEVSPDYDGGADVQLHGHRLETKKECAARQERGRKAKEAAKKREAKKKQAREDRDKREFERLKKVFGEENSCKTCKAQVDASHDCRKCKKGSNWKPIPVEFDPED